VIEGQGSVYHPAYSGVTVGLLHGSMPHLLVYAHAPARKHMSHYPQFILPPVSQAVKLVEDLTKPIFPAKVAALSLNTWGMEADAADAAVKRYEDECGLPASDPVRYGPEKLARAIETALAGIGRANEVVAMD